MATPSTSALDKGVLKETLVAEYSISQELPVQNRTRSEVFSSQLSSHCIVVIRESNSKFTVWLYSKAILKHTLEVTLSFLDEKNQQCYAVDKHLRISTSEMRKECATVDFGIIKNYAQKFLHDGLLKIQCCIDTPGSVASCFKPSRKDYNKLEADVQKHLLDIEKTGVLAKKGVLTWTIKIAPTKEVEARSDTLKFESSNFWLSLLNSAKPKRFEVCLNREPQGLPQKIKVTLGVLDNMAIMHYAKEGIIEDSSGMYLNYTKVFEDRGKFLHKSELKIRCVLQLLNSFSTFETSKSSRSSEPSRTATVSSSTEILANVTSTSSEPSQVKELTPNPFNKRFSISMENTNTELVTKNPMRPYSNTQDKFKLEEALDEMFRLLHEARGDAALASTITSLLFSTAKEEYKGIITKVLLNLLIENNYSNERSVQIVLRNLDHIIVTEEWLSFLKKNSNLANVIIQQLAQDK